jgi:hypothetical protein
VARDHLRKRRRVGADVGGRDVFVRAGHDVGAGAEYEQVGRRDDLGLAPRRFFILNVGVGRKT